MTRERRGLLVKLVRRLSAKELVIPPPSPTEEPEKFARWVLDRWRETGEFCCIQLHSDYDYTWDVWWVNHEQTGGGGHKHHKIAQSFETLDEAIIEGALVALRIKTGEVYTGRVKITWDHQVGKKKEGSRGSKD